MRGIWSVAAIAAVLGALVMFPMPAAGVVTRTPPTYRSIPVPGTTVAFNDRRQVVGWMEVPDVSIMHAYVWDDGVVTDLGNLVGAPKWSTTVDINDKGWVLGAASSTEMATFLWRDGELIDLGMPRGAPFAPAAINNRGQAVGWAWLEDAQPHAFLWQEGRFRHLGEFAANDMNDRNQVVGARLVRPDYRACWWQNGVRTDLRVPGVASYATEINDRGQIVGTYRTAAGHDRAFLWWRGRTTDLGTLGGQISRAASINDRGQVVGYSETKDGVSHPFLWERGRMFDLTTSGFSSWTQQIRINNRGDLLGSSLYVR